MAPPPKRTFVAQADEVDAALQQRTVGLVQHEHFARIRREVALQKTISVEKDVASNTKTSAPNRAKARSRARAVLSFDDEDDNDKNDIKNTKTESKPQQHTVNGSDSLVDDKVPKVEPKQQTESTLLDEDELPVFAPRKRVKHSDTDTTSSATDMTSSSDTTVKQLPRTSRKNPAVATDFLPDVVREDAIAAERRRLEHVWHKQQERIKQDSVSITYSYWDGTGHRSTVAVKKGDSISRFLDACRAQFPQLRNVAVDNLMYVKEDLIIPHHYTFYDFIANKTRGKSGPLFNFDVREDLRLVNDATVESDNSHAGKVIQRDWYEKNKHIFPYNRFEIFDPRKDYGSYTIKDTKSNSKT